MCTVQDEKESEPNKENVLYSFPAFDGVNGGENEKMPPLVLELIPLPLLSENFEQMPVGARGWYASAILSAMMILSYGSIHEDDVETRLVADNSNNNSFSKNITKGFDLLGEDLKQACASANCTSTSAGIGTNTNNVFLELGSGTIGLAGMAMAWIIAQHQRNATKSRDTSTSRNKVVLTDYDSDCLEQLERNAVGVRRTFGNYFSAIGPDNAIVNSTREGIIPDIDVVHLDWTEYDQDQSPLFPEKLSTSNDIHQNNISFACGAALVYTEDTAACADQVAKILRLHSKAVVWVVQWPRDGWFSILQQELTSAKYKSEDLDIRIQKFGPTTSPDMFSTEVQKLAQQLMPGSMQQELEMNIKDLRAIRITSTIS
eukprot:CAMPEP_0116107628 /NCGR_PEP_ID=MMETSP0327-20121206/16330_1 /TAXON_ID=44447 /ORGANISM="Pseudo-nitzschia delicatissima, Strain B596" /LENGTH=372 /DNA_ID=CAMNT_0003600439 /DNA_START=61 /DNA_END=1179 /DNA_ORIENTATION=+